VDRFNDDLARGRFPIDLAGVGAIGVDCRSLRDVLRRFPDRLPLSVLIETSVRHAREEGERRVDLFTARCVVSATPEDLDAIDKAALARSLAGRLAPGRGDG
jgi:hypothetical protein